MKFINIAHRLAENRLSTPRNKWIKNELSHLSKKDLEHTDMAAVMKKTFLSHTFDMLGMDFERREGNVVAPPLGQMPFT